MFKLNAENSAVVISTVEELISTGQLWVTIDGEDFYMPDLLEELLDLDEDERQWV